MKLFATWTDMKTRTKETSEAITHSGGGGGGDGTNMASMLVELLPGLWRQLFRSTE